MQGRSLHPGLELRLRILTERIARLRAKIDRARGLEKIELLGEIDELKRRCSILERRLQTLNLKRPGFRRKIEATVARIADDFMGTLGDFMLRLDSYRHAHRPTQSKNH